MIYIGADHRGFSLKEVLKKHLSGKNIAFEDMGAREYDEADDYVDFAVLVSEKVSQNPCEHKGIGICGSGHGMDMVLNKFPGLRAALCLSKERAIQSREHEDANILVLAADDVNESDAKEIVDAWLKTPFTKEERLKRRLKKMEDIEIRNFNSTTHLECHD